MTTLALDRVALPFALRQGDAVGVMQGYRIVTGQSQQPMMMLMGDSLRAALIAMAATSQGVTKLQVWNFVAPMTMSVGTASTDRLNSIALQQGSIGLILTTLPNSIPSFTGVYYYGN